MLTVLYNFEYVDSTILILPFLYRHRFLDDFNAHDDDKARNRRKKKMRKIVQKVARIPELSHPRRRRVPPQQAANLFSRLGPLRFVSHATRPLMTVNYH